MEPMRYDMLRTKLQALADEATCIPLGPEIRAERMKRYILRMACELRAPVTVRRVPRGVIFWRSTGPIRRGFHWCWFAAASVC